MSDPVVFVVYGEPASKSNSRELVYFNKKPRFIKSKKALAYGRAFQKQCPVLKKPIEDDVEVEMIIYYATRRPDLDESLILDLMQNYVYKNDRQVKRKIITWGLDGEAPRAEIKVRPLDSGELEGFYGK